jgi:hypothetical protein
LADFFQADFSHHFVKNSEAKASLESPQSETRIMQAASIQVDFFKGNKAEALRSQFGKHLFSFEFDVEDGFRLIYMFYAFVGYLFYWTFRHKVQQ